MHASIERRERSLGVRFACDNPLTLIEGISMQRRISQCLSFCMLMLSIGAGCGGGSYQPSRSTAFQIDAEAEIDDEAIRKAFEARPQMPASDIRLSYYTFDPEIASDLDKTLATIPGASSVYRIPPLLVTGQRRYQENYGYYGQSTEVSVKKLRLLAARAKTDVIVIVDHGYRNNGVNPLVALGWLVLPVFFVPFLDTVVKGYVETFVVDVRNGFLYGHLVQEDERGKAYATIYSKKADVLAAEQWQDLRGRFAKDLGALIEKERTRKASPEPLPPVPPPAAANMPATP
jgi:hypothetical protein